MKRLLLPAALLSLTWPGTARAQSAPADARHATVLDLTGATGPTLSYASAAAWRLWGLDAAGRFQVGVGVRGSYFFADETTLDRQTGTGLPLLQVLKPRLGALNAALHLRARVVGPVQLGFNIDLAGISFGPARVGNYPGYVTIETLRPQPTTANVLLGGTRDRGSLNSELYASVALPARWSLRVGFSHLVTEYDLAGDQFHRFRNLGAVGLSYQLP